MFSSACLITILLIPSLWSCPAPNLRIEHENAADSQNPLYDFFVISSEDAAAPFQYDRQFIRLDSFEFSYCVNDTSDFAVVLVSDLADSLTGTTTIFNDQQDRAVNHDVDTHGFGFVYQIGTGDLTACSCSAEWPELRGWNHECLSLFSTLGIEPVCAEANYQVGTPWYFWIYASLLVIATVAFLINNCKTQTSSSNGSMLDAILASVPAFIALSVILPLVDFVGDFVAATSISGSCQFEAMPSSARNATVAAEALLYFAAVCGAVVQAKQVIVWVKHGRANGVSCKSLKDFADQTNGMKQDLDHWDRESTQMLLQALLEDLPTMISTIIIVEHTPVMQFFFLINVVFSAFSFLKNWTFVVANVNHTLLQKGRLAAIGCSTVVFFLGAAPVVILFAIMSGAQFEGQVIIHRQSYHDVSLKRSDGLTWFFDGPVTWETELEIAASSDHLSEGYISTDGLEFPYGWFFYTVQFEGCDAAFKYSLSFNDHGCLLGLHLPEGVSNNSYGFYCSAQNITLEPTYAVSCPGFDTSDFTFTVHLASSTMFDICSPGA